MKRFTQLFCELDQTTRTNEKVAALESYFREAPPADAAWALQFLCGRTLPRAVPTKTLWQLTAEETNLPEWLIDECYDAVGDMAEAMALLMRDPGEGSKLSLSQIVEQRLVPLRSLSELARRELLRRTWRELKTSERLVWNKLITGNFRIGVARTLVIRALAAVANVDPAIMAHRVLGSWQPTPEDFQRLMSSADGVVETAKPYPFFLASPIEIKIKRGEDISSLGDVRDWFAEWKWDGIRAQLIRRGDDTLVWSRGDEMVTDSFPEIVEAGANLPPGTVLDGEILAWQNDRPLPFGKLQRRLGRKKVGVRTRSEFPIVFVAYDLLELDGKDLRARPLVERRKNLEEIVAQVTAEASQKTIGIAMPSLETPLLPGLEIGNSVHEDLALKPVFPLRLSPLVEVQSWEELARLQTEARARGVEGLMLKKKDSLYGVGRQRGDWWKWKIDPFVIDAVLICAQLGHGRRASLYTDYTFGLWDQGQLVPVAKAYSGLTDEEILQVDNFVRHNTTGKFGPVRTVAPAQVFEIAFEAIQKSTRHKSGVAVRFPRMSRWRQDKKPEEADTLDNLRALANFEDAA
ncbi:MAG TPA: ATP-dependent DNA ligase [Verrucomicrobiae bacterium]|nr:ATP-dependent DNA ligase [Verrucomicrobiae bacterium]